MTYPTNKKNTFKGEIRKDEPVKQVPVVQIFFAMVAIFMIIWLLDFAGVIEFPTFRPE